MTSTTPTKKRPETALVDPFQDFRYTYVPPHKLSTSMDTTVSDYFVEFLLVQPTHRQYFASTVHHGLKTRSLDSLAKKATKKNGSSRPYPFARLAR